MGRLHENVSANLEKITFFIVAARLISVTASAQKSNFITYNVPYWIY